MLWENEFVEISRFLTQKNNKLYLNITDLSQVGSVDDVSYKTKIPSVKWDDLKWDKT